MWPKYRVKADVFLSDDHGLQNGFDYHTSLYDNPEEPKRDAINWINNCVARRFDKERYSDCKVSLISQYLESNQHYWVDIDEC